ncbi:uncharacterized protein LOC125003576 [Mugil cephalus]|uniref:uncharacterized protein LOC125003576 n=1 Tax=Mugil cephalus TaxID=48193 RepID=UPI001FB605A8|nr:uncharacterized protein LOC125003576 [Mugil cephalus]
MAGLYWMMLTFFLAAPNSSAALDLAWLADVVRAIKNEYGTKGMFSLAVRIPYDGNLNQILQQVFTSDPRNNVRNTINNNEVYSGYRVVAAKVKQPDHAESRVVDHLDDLFRQSNDNDKDLLLFYVFASPCVEKCTNKYNPGCILERIKSIQQWNNYAVVFSTIFKPKNGYCNTSTERSTALELLGGSVGLNNIFRCSPYKCTCCSTGTGVADSCVSDDTNTGLYFSR